MPAIEARGVSKTYKKNGVEALKGIDLEVQEGEILCLLGPNGAGKTTLVRILATQLEPTAGEIILLGMRLRGRAWEIRQRLSTVPQSVWPDTGLTVREQIHYYLAGRGMGWRSARRAAEEVIEQLGLGDKRDEKIAFLSGGMARRVVLGMALACPSDLLFLDEPTAGLDVLIRRETWQLLARLKRRRTTILTTHSMEEAEVLADRVAIINEGELVAVGTPRELHALAPGRQKVVVAEDSLPRAEAERLGSLQLFAGNWALYTRDDEATRRLLDLAVHHRVEASVLNTNLEDVFVNLVGNHHQIRMGELQ